jgi:hypothetical protein
MVAPTTPRDALVKKRLREFFKVSPDFLSILSYLAMNRMRSISALEWKCDIFELLGVAPTKPNMIPAGGRVWWGSF